METTQVTKQELTVESPTAEFPTVLVAKIYPIREGKKTHQVGFRWLTKKPGDASNISAFGQLALGSLINTTENRFGSQNFEPEVVEQLGLKEGVNINETLKTLGMNPVRICIHEIVESEYNDLDESIKQSMSPKRNPSDGTYLMKDGEVIYRRTYLDAVGTPDVYVAHNGKRAATEDEEGAVRA